MNNKTIAAIATGFVLGLLLAPDEGSKTRKNLMKSCKKIKDKFDEWFPKKSILEADLVTLRQEIDNLEDQLSLKSKIELNKILDKIK